MIEIKRAMPEDVDDIVAIHNEAFKNFFLTSLGKRFLKLYYLSFIDCDEGCVFCAHKDNQVVGFSACSYVSRGFNFLLIKRNIVKYGIEAFFLLFTKPGALLRLAKNMTKKAEGVDDDGDYAELYSIAVSPSCQGKGIGGLLLAENERVIHECVCGGGGKTLINNRL